MRSQKGASCSLSPPEIEPGFKIPGGLYAGATIYYRVLKVEEGNRVRIDVQSGQLEVKGKIGRAPTLDSYQLIGSFVFSLETCSYVIDTSR